MRQANGSRWSLPDPAFLALLLSAFIALATWISFRKNIWLDETFTLDRTGTSLEQTLQLARYRSLKPPLYFVAVYYWRHLGDSIEFVRGLSTVAVALALVYLHRISIALGIGRGWRSVALVAALTPHLIWAAIEARAYGLTIFFLSACTWHFIRLWVTGSDRPWKDNVLFVLSGYAAILCFYYAGFIVAGLFVAGLFARDFRRLVWSGVALALLLAPWLPQIAEHVGQQGNYMPPLELGAGSAASQAASAGVWLLGLLPDIVFRNVSVVSRPGANIVLMLGAAGLLAARVALGRPRWTRAETMLVVAAAVGVACMAAIRLSNVQMMDLRHLSIAAPSLILLPPLLASRLQPGWVSRGAALGLLALFGLTAVSYARNEQGLRDVHSAALLLEREEQAGEPIVYLLNSTAPFEYYYHGLNRVRRFPLDPVAQPLIRPGQAMPPAERRHLLDLLAPADSGRGPFWIIEETNRPMAVGVVEATLHQPLAILGEWSFFGVRVTRARVAVGATGAAR